MKKCRILALALVILILLSSLSQAAVSLVLVNAERTSLANALNSDLGGGTIKLYTASAGTLIATVPLKSTTIGTVSNGVITIDCTSTTATTVAAGTVTYASFCSSGGTELVQGNVGTSSTLVVLTSNVFGSGDTVTITSGSLTVPAGS